MKLLENFKFEIPYNFDLTLLDFLLKEDYKNILYNRTAFMYLPSYFEDAINTRVESPIYKLLSPTSRQEYSNHIASIQNKLNIPIAVLLQYTDNQSFTKLQFYKDLGINTFIVADDRLADIIKNTIPNATTIASITKKLSFNEIMSNSLSMYDQIVLDFPFQRGLEKVKQLPRNHTYSILANNDGCLVDCNQCEHWKTGIPSCQYYHSTEYGKERNLALNHADYNRFYPYISHLKIQGREYSSYTIIKLLTRLLEDDFQDAHSDIWLNYADTLGLFNGTHRKNIQQFECEAKRDLVDFSFYIDSKKYSWIKGKVYQIIIDYDFGNLKISSENGVMHIFFPIYFETACFLKQIFNIDIEES